MTLLHLMTVLNCRCVLQKDELKPVKEVAPASPPQAMDISQSEAFSKQLLPVNVQDIDQDDGDNPQLVAEYVNDIYDYMRQLEVRLHILTLRHNFVRVGLRLQDISTVGLAGALITNLSSFLVRWRLILLCRIGRFIKYGQCPLM